MNNINEFGDELDEESLEDKKKTTKQESTTTRLDGEKTDAREKYHRTLGRNGLADAA
tara:strand:+ start:1047 stop:1217 length:171 start_codon:yes stop_codon:yes gene_type:complete